MTLHHEWNNRHAIASRKRPAPIRMRRADARWNADFVMRYEYSRRSTENAIRP